MNLISLRLGPMCTQFQSSVGIEAYRLCSCAIMLSKWFLISLLALGVQNIFAGNYIGEKIKTVFCNYLIN